MKPNPGRGGIVIYESRGVPRLEVRLEKDMVWLNQSQIAVLFGKERSVVTKHIGKILSDKEVDRKSNVQKMHIPSSDKPVEFYSLDMVLAVGYRTNSARAINFRKWVTRILKEYLLRGYALNKKLLAEKQKELESLKSGIVLIERSIKHQIGTIEEARSLASILGEYSKGLKLLDDYDSENLDLRGRSRKKAVFIDYEGFSSVIAEMKKGFKSSLFGREKDQSFKSSIGQIYQSFGGRELYPTLEEKAVMLLYFIVKNHSFFDGNKRIAAACFLHFLNRNRILYDPKGSLRMSSDALAALTLLIAESKPKEMETVKRIGISLLNRER